MPAVITQIIKSAGLVLIEGDCTQIMPNLSAECVNSIVTDPPYGLEFMGKEWDKLLLRQNRAEDYPSARQSHGPDSYVGGSKAQEWHYRWAVEALRLLKPGGHMLVFGGTRTYHRLACAVEDAGFEIRDSIHWVYGSGFPKSMDVSKAIDKAAGVEREVVGRGLSGRTAIGGDGQRALSGTDGELGHDLSAPTTNDAKQWDGWGTALKPAHEPILLARKPLGEKTVAANVLLHGTGGLNIDGGRIGTDEMSTACTFLRRGEPCLGHGDAGNRQSGATIHTPSVSVGRFPANFILSHDGDCVEECVGGCPVAELDAQSGNRLGFSGGGISRIGMDDSKRHTFGEFKGNDKVPQYYGDKGGASRFFYQAKSSKLERNKGCDSLYWQRTKDGHTPITQSEYDALDPKSRAWGNIHPTVKPLDLMRYLIRLITPPDGIVLEPFLGSGTTALAAHIEGFGCLAMEQDPTSALISRARWEAR